MTRRDWLVIAGVGVGMVAVASIIPRDNDGAESSREAPAVTVLREWFNDQPHARRAEFCIDVDTLGSGARQALAPEVTASEWRAFLSVAC